MRLRMVGLSHQTAPVAFRERVALDQDAAVRTINRLREQQDVAEAFVLSTCNRTEVYAVLLRDDAPEQILVDALAAEADVERREIDQYLYRRRDADVVEHLYMVAGGLDSMVVGENQILAQVRDAYSTSVACRANGALVNRLMHSALRVGKQIRTRTGIGEGHVSVASVACDLAEKIFADLSGRSALLVGAGETGELVVTHLLGKGVRDLRIANRTASRAQALADRFGGRAVPWDRLLEAVARVDVVISCTGSPEPVLTAEDLRGALRGRHGPLFAIDIAVPRDVEPAAGELEQVFLYDLDALRSLVDQSVDRRRAEVHHARQIVADEVAKFVAWHRSQQVTPTIVQLREHFEATRVAEIEKLRRDLSEEDFARVDRATRAMVNKLLHHPTVQMKQAARRPDSGLLLKAFRQLLGLDDEEPRR